MRYLILIALSLTCCKSPAAPAAVDSADLPADLSAVDAPVDLSQTVTP